MAPSLVVSVLSRGGRSPALKLDTILKSFFTPSPLGWKCGYEVARAGPGLWTMLSGTFQGWTCAWGGKVWCHSLQRWHSLAGFQQCYWHKQSLVC